jgi:hypothetical protein
MPCRPLTKAAALLQNEQWARTCSIVVKRATCLDGYRWQQRPADDDPCTRIWPWIGARSRTVSAIFSSITDAAARLFGHGSWIGAVGACCGGSWDWGRGGRHRRAGFGRPESVGKGRGNQTVRGLAIDARV